MSEDFEKIAKQLLYTQKVRCNLCHGIPIIKEIVHSGGLSYFISAECLNNHGIFFYTLDDFCQDSNQFENVKCNKCNKIQGIIKSKKELFQYCKECQFLCPSCVNSKHKKFKKKHHLIEIQNLDFICLEHQKNYTKFCEKCNINICELCEPNHTDHKNIYQLSSIIPDKNKIKKVEEKINQQKKQIDEINNLLNNFLKVVNEKTKEYQNKLNIDLKLNTQIFNCLDVEHPNYQSIINFDKIIDIDYSDISWIEEINNQLDKFIKLIKEKAPNNSSTVNITKTSTIIDKDLMEKFQKSMSENQNKTSIKALENRNKYDDFSECQLLKEIGQKNQIIFRNDEIIGNLKDIYIMPKCKDYLLIIDNGIFLYEQETNDLVCYIDINDNLEYNEINSIQYEYDNKLNRIYLYIGIRDKIKIYCIDENKEYRYSLIQELKIKDLINFCIDDNFNIFILSENGYLIYKKKNNIYELEIENINIRNEKYNLFSNKNYIILGKKEKDELLFLDKKNNFETLFFIHKIKVNEQSQFIEINENLICLSYENVIQVIDLQKKCLSHIYNKSEINNLLSIALINNKQILLSGNKEEKYLIYILEFNESYSKLNVKKKIDNIRCDIAREISPDKIFLYTNYGVNILEI